MSLWQEQIEIKHPAFVRAGSLLEVGFCAIDVRFRGQSRRRFSRPQRPEIASDGHLGRVALWQSQLSKLNGLDRDYAKLRTIFQQREVTYKGAPLQSRFKNIAPSDYDFIPFYFPNLNHLEFMKRTFP